jgi:tRNA A-37 threonylcarbamoyl transferase component Bud32
MKTIVPSKLIEIPYFEKQLSKRITIKRNINDLKNWLKLKRMIIRAPILIITLLLLPLNK